VEREARRLNLDPALALTRLRAAIPVENDEQLLEQIGSGRVSRNRLTAALRQAVPPMPRPMAEPSRAGPVADEVSRGGITVQGVGNLLTTLAHCCHPIPGDPIVGLISRGKGVIIHRQDCPDILRLQPDHPRLVSVSWGEHDQRERQPVPLLLRAFDRRGLISDVSTVLHDAGINIQSIHSDTDPGSQQVRMRMVVEVADQAALLKAIDRLERLPSVRSVARAAIGRKKTPLPH